MNQPNDKQEWITPAIATLPVTLTEQLAPPDAGEQS